MEKTKKHLKVVGWFFVIVAILDALLIAVAYFTGNLTEASIAAQMKDYGLTVDDPTGYLVTSLVVSILSTLLTLYLGVKAIKQAKGTVNGYGHISWAIVLLIYYIITLGLEIYVLVVGSMEISMLITSAIWLILIIGYIKWAKELKN